MPTKSVAPTPKTMWATKLNLNTNLRAQYEAQLDGCQMIDLAYLKTHFVKKETESEPKPKTSCSYIASKA